MTQRWVVCWHSKLTGPRRSGPMTLEAAERIRDERNRRWPAVRHWIEPAK